MKKFILSIIACSLLMFAFSTKSNAQGTLVHYWHFNNYSDTMRTPDIQGIDADYSRIDTATAKVLYTEMPGTSPSFATYEDSVTVTTGTPDYDTVNLRLGELGDRALRPRNPTDSMWLLFYIPSTNYTHLLLQYGSESSSTSHGPLHQDFSYSTDSGSTWKTSGLSETSDSAWLVFHRIAVSLAADSTTRNNDKLVFRIIFSGNTSGTSGNNRFDNITLDGDSIETSTVSITGATGTICAGASVHFAANAVINTANTTPVYTWYVNGVVAGTDSTGFTTTTLTSGSTVKCVVTDNADGSFIAASNVITVTITPLPIVNAILGPSSVCVTASVTLTDAGAVSSIGTWSASNSNASVGSISGIVMGVSAGIDTIKYSKTNTCGTKDTTFVITVIAPPTVDAITGTATVCPAASITLSDGILGGTWSSSADADITTGGVLTGVSAGIDTVTYTKTNTCGSADATFLVTVHTPATVGPITGPSNVCPGDSITLADAVTGGTWSISNSFATISATGGVRAYTDGFDTVTYYYSNVCGSDDTTFVVNISTMPDAGVISGPAVICIGVGTSLSETISGGTWSLTNGNATISGSGVISGSATGNDTVKYTVTSCGSSDTTFPVTIIPAPVAGSISGGASVCADSIVILADTASGGTWSSSGAFASITTSGVVFGVSGGVGTISYSVSNVCDTVSAIETFTVIQVNPGTVTGLDTLCVGDTTTLTETVTGIGIWGVTNTTLASITVTGPYTALLTALAAGTDSAGYIIPTPCLAYAGEVVTILPASACPTAVKAISSNPDELKVYPNPSNGNFTVYCASPISEPVSITLSNIVGEKVKELSILSNQSYQVGLDVPAGIYILNAATSHGTYTARIVVQQ